MESRTSAWRLLKLETHDAFTNMAIDEAILRARMANLVPDTVRFYRWKPSAVSIGKFQNVENEAQLDNCRKHSVDVVRRITGGGTVYHDADDEVTYSVVASKQSMKTEDITAVYVMVYAGIAEALRYLGLEADFNVGDARTCPNLTVKGKKISGSAQSHKGGHVLQHGTLLLNVDLEKMFTFLRVPWARTCIEVAGIAKNKITSIKQELKRAISIDEASQALVKGFQTALSVQLVKDELTPYERKLVETLRKEKYSTDDWNLKGKTTNEKETHQGSSSDSSIHIWKSRSKRLTFGVLWVLSF